VGVVKLSELRPSPLSGAQHRAAVRRLFLEDVADLAAAHRVNDVWIATHSGT
jgi:hypothetical protein